MKLSEKILRLRKQRGMSQEEMAEKLNVSRQAVSRWETGSALPDAANVFQLSRLFGVSADYLLNDELEDEGPAADAGSMKASPGSGNRRRLGLGMAALGLLGNAAIYILSRFIKVMVPLVVYRNGEKWYEWSSERTSYSYKYFVKAHNLEFLTTVCWIFLAAGLVLAFLNREKLKALKEKILRRRQEKSSV